MCTSGMALLFFSISLYVFTEAIKVAVEFKNPLQIAIPISNVSLICEHSVKSDAPASGKSLG